MQSTTMKMSTPMKYIKTVLIFCTIFCASVAFAADIEIRLQDGSIWNGVTGQVITIQYEENGKKSTFTGELTRATKTYIMVGDEFLFIDKITSIEGEQTEPKDDTDSEDISSGTEETGDSTDTAVDDKKSLAVEGDLPKGVFVLPLHQMVGTYFRPTEIRDLIAHIDEKYGPGQIIVFEIHSGGGSVLKWSEIRDVVFEARERHRFIAWIDHAISGAAATGFLCDEVYYRSAGELGSITMYSGHIDNVSPDWQLFGWIKELESVLARTSHTPLVAGCMVKVDLNFSYDVDPETGELTYYAHEFGDVVLSKSGRNLTLGSQEALDSGLCDGIADTGEELASHLDLEEWIEIDSYGRDIAEQWWATLGEFEQVGNELRAELGGNVSGDSPRERIGNQIKAGEELIRWSKKLGETGMMMGLSEENVSGLKRMIEDLKHQRSNL
jgi:hypothetical protein